MIVGVACPLSYFGIVYICVSVAYAFSFFFGLVPQQVKLIWQGLVRRNHYVFLGGALVVYPLYIGLYRIFHYPSLFGQKLEHFALY